MCGCGRKTNLAKQHAPSRGTVKGQPVRFIFGHQCRRSPHEYLVDPSTGCWVWQRAIKPEGYGYLNYQGKTTYAHRLFYERSRGPIEPGMDIDHLCRNRACVNPDHMEVVPRAINAQRGARATITREQADEIRTKAEPHTFGRYRELAAEYGTSESVIHSVVYRKTWK